MAEFQEVVGQLIRLCETQIDCDKCPVDKVGCCGNVNALKQSELIEKAVMLWAAEHPEPVYPTWKEWLEEQRVVVHFDSVNEKGTKVKWELTNKSNCRIPADTAQKLGIEPKEGQCGT